MALIAAGPRPRSRMGWLFALILLPGVLIGGAFLLTLYRIGEDALEQGALQTARALSQVFDGALDGRRIRLEALAVSPALAAGDLAAFHRQARQGLGAAGTDAIALAAADGRLLLSTLAPLGAPLPKAGAPELLTRALASGQAAVSGLHMGPVRPGPITALAIPLADGAHGARALIHGQPVSQLRTFLLRQRLPAGWSAQLLDRDGMVIAASADGPDALGRLVSEALAAALARDNDGRLAWRDGAGAPEFLVHSRSEWSGWTVLLRMRRGVLLTSLYREVAWAAAGILAALAAGAAMAWYFNRATLGSLAALGVAAQRAADGIRNVRVPLTGPLEMVRLARRFNEMQAAREAADARLELAASVFSATAEGNRHRAVSGRRRERRGVAAPERRRDVRGQAARARPVPPRGGRAGPLSAVGTLMRHQHRQRHRARDGARDAAQQQLAVAGVAVAAHQQRARRVQQHVLGQLAPA